MSEPHTRRFLAAVSQVCETIEPYFVDVLVDKLVALKKSNGRLFVLGVGGSAANASHAVNDFRKLCNIEAYAPTDNVAELTARANDDGWSTIFVRWLMTSRLCDRDAILVLSVGGGTEGTSVCISRAVVYAKSCGAKVLGVVGRANGTTAKLASGDDVVILIPEVEPEWVTALSETFQAVLWHCIVNHPVLR